MNKLGLKQVAIARLQLPGDFRHRLTQEHVRERAESVKRWGGAISYPLVRKADSLVVFGVDRIAAHVLAGLEHVVVELCQATDDEAMELRLEENAQRRHDPKRQHVEREALLKLYEQRALKELPPDPSKYLAVQAKAAARKKLARAQGIKPDSLVRQARRVRAAERVEAAPPPTVDTLGLYLAPARAAALRTVTALLAEAERALQIAQGALTKLEAVGFNAYRQQRMYEHAHTAAALCRAAAPRKLCPFCKLVPVVMDNCAGCEGVGWLASDQVDQVPGELWKPDVVLFAGSIVSYAKMAEVSLKNGKPVEGPEPEEADPFGVG